jgi:hypothetical protein
MSEPFNPFAAPETGGYAESSLPVGDFERLAGVERGLRMVYLGICGIIISVIIAGLSAILFPPLAIVAGLGVLICWLMLIIGPFLCLTAPEESGAKGLIIASILFQLMGFGLSVISMLGIDSPVVTQAVVQLSGAAGSVLFVFFLMKIAKYIGRDDLRKKGANILIGSVVLIAVTVLAFVTVIVGGSGEMLGVIAILIIGVGALILFLMYANLINYLSKAIASLRANASVQAT